VERKSLLPSSFWSSFNPSPAFRNLKACPAARPGPCPRPADVVFGIDGPLSLAAPVQLVEFAGQIKDEAHWRGLTASATLNS